MNSLLKTMMGWLMMWVVPVKGPNRFGDWTGRKQSRYLYLHRAIRCRGQNYFTFALDLCVVRLTGEWGDPDSEYGRFDGLRVKWYANNFYDVVRHVALVVVYQARSHQEFNDSQQEVEWATLGPIRLRVTDNITIDHSDVELSLTIGPPKARLMIGYRWAAGEDAICDSGFFGRRVWRNHVKLFGV